MSPPTDKQPPMRVVGFSLFDFSSDFVRDPAVVLVVFARGLPAPAC